MCSRFCLLFDMRFLVCIEAEQAQCLSFDFGSAAGCAERLCLSGLDYDSRAARLSLAAEKEVSRSRGKPEAFRTSGSGAEVLAGGYKSCWNSN